MFGSTRLTRLRAHLVSMIESLNIRISGLADRLSTSERRLCALLYKRDDLACRIASLAEILDEREARDLQECQEACKDLAFHFGVVFMAIHQTDGVTPHYVVGWAVTENGVVLSRTAVAQTLTALPFTMLVSLMRQVPPSPAKEQPARTKRRS